MSTTTTPIMSAKSNKTAKLPAKPRAKRTPAAKPPAKCTRATKASKTAETAKASKNAERSKTAELPAEPAAKQADTVEPAAEPSASGTPAAKPSDTAEPITKPSDTAEPIAKPSDSGTPTAKISESGRLGAKPSETRPIQYHESAAEALVMGGVTNTATAKKLASMDWIRPVMVKKDRGLNMARPVNVEAILGYSRGELAEAVCDCCTDEIKPRERSALIASSSTVTAEGADRHRRVAKRKRSTTKEKWWRLLIAVEGVADAIEDIVNEMED
ncbi:uncharacterized protein H6S33_012498 [Morchella sextelata]|uniref:uncharacterized protein n=1 Tax=Morchella sextelata TaxID=1174677 RepID=UPI001D054B2D|nr:uncharacterized protein H6S33_012498 [Morchella sextelata]KAH0609952.1 hypothetical protein H6S33_012498 [Morchella sextelata]